MKKLLQQACIGLICILAVLLVVSGLKQKSFAPVFWGVLIVIGLYRHITNAKPLNKYILIIIFTGAIFSLNLMRGNPALEAFVISGASGLLMISLLAIFDFILKPLWRRFGPPPKVHLANNSSYKNQLFINAAANGDVGTLHDLILENFDVNAVDRIGATALMYAARNNQIECIKVLLDAGANPSLKTNKGHTAMWFAENNSHAESALLLKNCPLPS